MATDILWPGERETYRLHTTATGGFLGRPTAPPVIKIDREDLLKEISTVRMGNGVYDVTVEAQGTPLSANPGDLVTISAHFDAKDGAGYVPFAASREVRVKAPPLATACQWVT